MQNVMYEPCNLLICVPGLCSVTPGGFGYTSHNSPQGWYHIILYYLGSNHGEGIRLYQDGAEVASVANLGSETYGAGDGRIVVGRSITNLDQFYGNIQVDELLLFNQALTPEEIQMLSVAI